MKLTQKQKKVLREEVNAYLGVGKYHRPDNPHRKEEPYRRELEHKYGMPFDDLVRLSGGG